MIKFFNFSFNFVIIKIWFIFIVSGWEEHVESWIEDILQHKH